MSRESDPVLVYLDTLFARGRPSTLIEVRWRTTSGMGRRFVEVRDRVHVADTVHGLSSRTDVFVGVLPRWRRAGGRAAIVSDPRTVWVDLDTDTAARALEPVDPAPNLTVSSSPGHLHAYWTLTRAVPPAVIERANRRLAWALGGDLASTDAPRILRPPSSVHHGRGVVPVTLASVSSDESCRLGSLVGGLPDPPGATHARRSSRRRSHGSAADPLLDIAPERYIGALTGQRVGRSRKVRCPLHDDRTPSLHVYVDAARGWYCFGCRRGGSVYDLAAGLGLPGAPVGPAGAQLRGPTFRALRERLLEIFDLPAGA